MLLRLQDLAKVNQLLGREATDEVLTLIGEALQTYTQNVHGSVAGRLNGADFALWLPAPAVLEDSAEALTAALQQALQRAAGEGGRSVIRLALGGVELARSLPLSQWFGQADAALAEAEREPGALGVSLKRVEGTEPPLPHGERAWRAQIEAALAQGHVRLLAYPVLDGAQHLLHWECPLHIGLAGAHQATPDFVPASTWLPLAQRTGLTVEVDLAAVSAALGLIQQDGQQRCINLASASLRAPAFLGRLRALLRSQPQAARQIGLEVDAEAALGQFELVQELSRAVHPLGVRVGLEHAGANLQKVERLYQLGLDFVKLDRSVASGVADDPSRAGFVRSLVIMLHSLSLQVIAEGVDDARDAHVLLDCGVNGLTGPWATGHQA
jgi:EAL domain-containing protein (putative c-di-GMP-specific phosphodiesterase class I)/GGDEF domain-containing protein